MCSYIQRWSIIKNPVEDVSDELAVDDFRPAFAVWTSWKS
jgi:hypothetical protein